ncbi:MAG: thioredoxin family protein [Planctomycetes bacterium]|jgi:hypothetical protein|nr:thioredoxin family protein [Planctomycetota bacterium]
MPRLAASRTLALTLLASFAPTTTAQAPTDPAELQRRAADKLAQPFLRLHEWHTDLGAAQRTAARDGKLILVHCTRSFMPCGTSIRCEQQVLSSPEFAAVAAEAVLYCHVTSHVDATADQRLAEWRGSGWPHHVVLDATGRVLGTHESHRDKSAAEFRALLAAARSFLQVERDTLAAERRARRERLQAGLQAGALDLTTARELFATCEALTAAESRELADRITDLEIGAALASVDRFAPAAQIEAGGRFVAMHRLGKRPFARNAVRDFWGGILVFQEQAATPNLELAKEALGALEQRFGGERGYRGFLDARREWLVQASAAADAAKGARTF